MSDRTAWRGRYATWGNLALQEYPLEEPAPTGLGQRMLPQNLRMQRQYEDAETGLYYNTFRYFDPDVERFVSQDPIGLAGRANLYQFGPNTGGWIDPWGLCKSPPKPSAKNEPRLLLNGPIRQSPRGMSLERHKPNNIAKFAGKSKFNSNENLSALINSGTQQRMVKQSSGNFVRTWDVGRPIGVDRATGQQTSIVTTVTRPNGELVTAFPGQP